MKVLLTALGLYRGPLTVVAAIVAALAGLVGGIFLLENHGGHVSCLRLHEQTGLATRYARSGVDGECYVQVNGRWVPEDRWRNIGSDD